MNTTVGHYCVKYEVAIWIGISFLSKEEGGGIPASCSVRLKDTLACDSLFPGYFFPGCLFPDSDLLRDQGGCPIQSDKHAFHFEYLLAVETDM